MDKQQTRGQSNLLTVTVDINERFHLSWGNPTEDQHQRAGFGDSTDERNHLLDGIIHVNDSRGDSPGITMEGVQEAYLSKDEKVVTLSYAGRNKAYVVMHASLVPILRKYDIVSILRPAYFHQSRTGGRIAVRADGFEINILTLLGDHLGIEDPSWSTKNCWREDPTKVVSKSAQPVGGTREYMKAYYAKTTEVRRTARAEMKKAKALAVAEQRTRTDTIDDIIASLKGNGGGGPFPPSE